MKSYIASGFLLRVCTSLAAPDVGGTLGVKLIFYHRLWTTSLNTRKHRHWQMQLSINFPQAWFELTFLFNKISVDLKSFLRKQR